MRRFLDNHDRPTTANPLRERMAPPTRGVNQTLMAVALAGDPATISALKSAQQKSQQDAAATSAALVTNPTKKQQEAHLEQIRNEMERADRLWWEIHESHRGLIDFPPFEVPYTKMAGPYHCRLCKEYLQILTDSQYRQKTALKDHFAPEDDPFSPEIRDQVELPSDPALEAGSDEAQAPRVMRLVMREDDEETAGSEDVLWISDSRRRNAVTEFSIADWISSVADEFDSLSEKPSDLASGDTKTEPISESSLIPEYQSPGPRHTTEAQASFVDPADIPLPGSPAEIGQIIGLSPQLPKQDYELSPELARPPSPPRLWQQTTELEPKSKMISFQHDEEFNAREREARRDNDSFVDNEADLSPVIAPNTRLWSPRKTNLASENGSRIMAQIKQYFSLPSTLTPVEVFQAGETLGEHPWSPGINPPVQESLPPHIPRTQPQTPLPRVRAPLFINSSEQALQLGQEIKSLAESLDWDGIADSLPSPSSPLQEPSPQALEEANGYWEATGWVQIEDASNTTTRIIRTHLTRHEVLCYGRWRWRQHRVSKNRLSLLRNETVIVDELSDDDEGNKLLEEWF